MATLDLGKVVGESATITVGTTTTLPAGSDATVENVGTSLDAVLNFGIPKGADGETESSYNNLTNKPQINSVELNGNKSLNDLGIQPAGNYLTQETDPVFNASASADITSQDITNWNNKSDFSGSYNDLTNKPTIPDSTSDLTNDSGFITNSTDGLTNYYTKTEVDGKVSAVYKYKGTVATYADLPSTGLTVGDVYNVETDGSNYAWNGTVWDKLGGDIDLSGYQTKIDSSHKLDADLIDDTSSTNKFVTSAEKTTWGNKYDKPLAGIPSTDLSSAVQTSLGKADTALQSEAYTGTITSVKMNGSTVASSGEADLGTVITSHQDITGKEDKTNKVTSISSSSTDTEYPSAKAVYDALGAAGGESFFVESSTNFILKGKKKGVYSFGLGAYSNVRIGVSTASYVDRYVLGGIVYVLQDIPDTAPTGLENNTQLVRFLEYNFTGNIAFVTGTYRTSSGNELDYTNRLNQMQLVSLSGNQSISGVKTFSTLPESSVTPTTNNQLVNKSYVDGLVGNISTVLSSLTTVQGGE